MCRGTLILCAFGCKRQASVDARVITFLQRSEERGNTEGGVAQGSVLYDVGDVGAECFAQSSIEHFDNLAVVERWRTCAS